MELMYQQTEQTQEDCQFFWVKFCAKEPIQELSPVDVDLTLTCNSYTAAISVSIDTLLLTTFCSQAYLEWKAVSKTLLNHIMVQGIKSSKYLPISVEDITYIPKQIKFNTENSSFTRAAIVFTNN